MADLVIPKLGESISEAVIAKWLKQVGETISVDEPVVDLETDKVSVALPAPAAGVLAEQKYPPGATVKIGEVIGRIAPGPEIAIAPKSPEVASAAAEATAPAPAEARPPAPTDAKPRPPAEARAPAPTDTKPRAPTPADLPAVRQSRTLPPSVRKALREGATAPVAAIVPAGAPASA